MVETRNCTCLAIFLRFCFDKVLKRREEMVCYRVMYDDVNETFWSVDRVHAFLPEGCAHTATRHVSSKPGTARGAYVHFRQLLLNAKKKGTVDTLRNYFHKTYFELVAHIQILPLSMCQVSPMQLPRAGTLVGCTYLRLFLESSYFILSCFISL